jgi:hypothetical protein
MIIQLSPKLVFKHLGPRPHLGRRLSFGSRMSHAGMKRKYVWGKDIGLFPDPLLISTVVAIAPVVGKPGWFDVKCEAKYEQLVIRWVIGNLRDKDQPPKRRRHKPGNGWQHQIKPNVRIW